MLFEKNEEQHAVEHLVREAFWNVYRPGCLEHYILHEMRKHPDFIPELKRQGYSKLLLDETLAQAKAFDIKALCFEGNIDFYGKSGFDYV